MPEHKIEQQLESLAALRAQPTAEGTPAVLRTALRDRVNIVAAKAAQITGELQLSELIPDLLLAFERLFLNPAKHDPQCWGKNAIAKALKYLDYDESAPFLRGMKHVQMEPVWGGQEDTATTLRGTSALALLQCSDITRENKLWSVMRLLSDPAAPVRRDAAVALQQLAGIESALLLRLKARMGDKEPAVTGQVLESILAIEGEGGVSFAAEFLGSPDQAIREEAALALGASRLAGALSPLKEAWDRARNAEDRPTILRAMAASRQGGAIEFILSVVREGREREAVGALETLETYRYSADIRLQTAKAVAARTERAIQEYFRQHFTSRDI
ncbi:MAG: HEAT repeat domain-containing protein [Bryobacteraceae bacterium]